MHKTFWSKNLEKIDYWGDLGVAERIILKWMLNE
jgi:hypothetical protein